MVMVLTIFTGCSSKSVPMSLNSEWKQSNSKSEDAYQTATIKDNTIEIYFVSDNGDTKSLYWAGSVIAPKTEEEPYIWDSVNDHSKTEKSLLASSLETKSITYEKGILSYTVKIMGTSTIVKLEMQK